MMNHNFCKFSALIFFIIISFNSFSQVINSKYPFDKWTATEINAANTAKSVNYLTQDEKNVIFFMNLARINGKLFAQTYAQKYMDSTKQKKNNYVTTLISTLKSQKDLKPLIPMEEICSIAKKYAYKMGQEGSTGHKESNKRFATLKTGFTSRGENCDYGFSDPLAIVMDLLIDEGISDYGHRNNILDKEFNFIGVAIQPHKKYKVNCVMDFICVEKK